MPRRPRIHLAGHPLHIVQRGHNREACIFAEDDYHAYRRWLGEARKESACLLQACPQMTNHAHLPTPPLARESVFRFVISLDRRYVPHIGKTYRRAGASWDSRNKSSLVQEGALLLTSHPCSALGGTESLRLAAYRPRFLLELDADAIGDIRMAPHHGQLPRDSRFLASIERATGQRREVKPCGRSRKTTAAAVGEKEPLSLIT